MAIVSSVMVVSSEWLDGYFQKAVEGRSAGIGLLPWIRCLLNASGSTFGSV
jgi:hypothetical protein